MADPKKIVPGSVDGDFFVDTTCIGCGNCRDLAPTVFSKIPPYYAITKQPADELELRQTLEALVCCPVGAVGSREKHDIKSVIDSYPQQIEDDVYYLGFNSPHSAGGKSYIVLNADGNWMIDSPKYSPRLVKWIRGHGGLKYIFLTHRDDVAEADRYATEFGAQRIIHREDLEAQPDAEIVMDGYDEDLVLEPGFRVIPTPGHTSGHCMLLYQDKFLFSGDVFTSKHRFGDNLEVWEPYYCWESWEEQTRSIERLVNYDFIWTLPSHGIRYNAGSSAQMRKDLLQCVEKAKTEPEPLSSTPERIAFFERYIPFLKQSGHFEFAEKMSRVLEKMHEQSTHSKGNS